MGQLIGFVLIFSLVFFFPSRCQEEKCCSTKVVKKADDSSLDGTYTLASEGAKREEICIDGCVYKKEDREYCFISKPVSESASEVTCEDGPTQSLTEAAVQAKEEADKAKAEIEAADASIKAAEEASSALDALNFNDFLASGRSKRQNTNTIDAPPGTDVSIQSTSQTSNDNNAPPGSNVQPESSSGPVTSSSTYPAPTTCANLKALMDDITGALKGNPADVRPMIDALKAIKKPLAEPCSQDDISQLETKRTTAKAAALDAIIKQDEIQKAAFKKLKAANEKLDSLNEQLKGRHCFNINENLYGTQNYDLLFVKSNELVGIWKFVFDQNIAITMELPGILFSCTSSSSSSRQNDQSSTTVCTSLSEVPLGQHNIKVSSGDSSASGYTPWVKAPMPITFTVGDEDQCKQGDNFN